MVPGSDLLQQTVKDYGSNRVSIWHIHDEGGSTAVLCAQSWTLEQIRLRASVTHTDVSSATPSLIEQSQQLPLAAVSFWIDCLVNTRLWCIPDASKMGKGSREFLEARKSRAIVALPIEIQDSIIGMMTLEWFRVRTFSDEELQEMRQITKKISLHIPATYNWSSTWDYQQHQPQ